MKFNDLSIQEKAAVIKLGVGGGLRSLLEIRLFWDGMPEDTLEDTIDSNEYKKGGSIHIKPENRGKFNATKKRTGKTTEELTHSKNPLTRKRAIFALNAKKWNHKHLNGGYIDDLNPDLRRTYVFNTPLGGSRDFYMPRQEPIPELSPIQAQYIEPIITREQYPSDNWPTYDTSKPPASGALGKDRMTFALEFAPALIIGAGPSLLATPFTRQLFASEIGGRTIDNVFRTLNGRSFALTLSYTSGLPEWLAEFLNPGYLINGKSFAGIGAGISNRIGKKIRGINTTIRSQRILKNIMKSANEALDKGDFGEYNRIMNNLKWQNDVPDPEGIGDLNYFLNDIPVGVRREGNSLFVLYPSGRNGRLKWDEIEFQNKFNADHFEKEIRDQMQDRNLWKQMSRDFLRLGHGSRIALVTNSDMSINSAPIYYGLMLRYARAGKGEIIPVVDNGVQRMMKLNKMGNRGRKYNLAIDKWNNEIRQLLGKEDIPSRISFFGNDYIPAYYFRKFDKGGIITDPMGQLNHPGQPTRIPGTEYGTSITNEGVEDDLFVRSSDGEYAIIPSGAKGPFYFSGSFVDEFPIGHKNQLGGLFRRQQTPNYLYNTYGLNLQGKARYVGSANTPIFGYQNKQGINQSIGRDYSMPDYNAIAITSTPFYMNEKPERQPIRRTKQDIVNFLWAMENEHNVGLNEDGTYSRYMDPNGRDYDVGPGLKIGSAIANKQFYTREELDDAAYNYYLDSMNILLPLYDEKYGDGSFDRLDDNVRMAIFDVMYRVGLNGVNPNTWPNLFEAAYNNDIENLLRESRTRFKNKGVWNYDNARVRRVGEYLYPDVYDYQFKNSLDPDLKIIVR